MKIKCVYNFIFLPRSYSAITLYPFIFFATSKKDTLYTTYKHEMTHVKQIRQVGVFKFYLSYLLYYLAGLLRFRDHFISYYNIPFEVEAFTQQITPLTEYEALELGVE